MGVPELIANYEAVKTRHDASNMNYCSSIRRYIILNEFRKLLFCKHESRILRKHEADIKIENRSI